jgi:hypothetical protein
MDGFEVPLATWQVHATAAELSERSGRLEAAQPTLAPPLFCHAGAVAGPALAEGIAGPGWALDPCRNDGMVQDSAAITDTAVRHRLVRTSDGDRCRTVGGRAVAELAPEAPAPAIGDVCRSPAASLAAAGAHLREGEAAGDREGRQLM